MLAELHDKAPEHSWRASRREIEAVFGKSVDELFDSIEHRALASGSIAQVPMTACLRACAQKPWMSLLEPAPPRACMLTAGGSRCCLPAHAPVMPAPGRRLFEAV